MIVLELHHEKLSWQFSKVDFNSDDSVIPTIINFYIAFILLFSRSKTPFFQNVQKFHKEFLLCQSNIKKSTKRHFSGASKVNFYSSLKAYIYKERQYTFIGFSNRILFNLEVITSLLVFRKKSYS